MKAKVYLIDFAHATIRPCEQHEGEEDDKEEEEKKKKQQRNINNSPSQRGDDNTIFGLEQVVRTLKAYCPASPSSSCSSSTSSGLVGL